MKADDQRTEPPAESAAGDGDSIRPSLLLRVKQNDPHAWERLVDLYGPTVLLWCRRKGRLGEADAEDAAQEVFRAVATGIGGFRRDRQGDTFRGWLWGITRHKIGDYWRKRECQAVAAGGSTAQQRLEQEPESILSDLSADTGQPEMSGLFARALELIRGEFRQKTWQAFWRVTVDSAPVAQVAVELGMSTGAIYVAKSRVLTRLREELHELEDVHT